MTGHSLISGVLVACLLLALAGCGNKGPLFLPEDDPTQQDEDTE